ncbi:MAG: hypothetical protein CR217_19770, partial [Beijerinckiaceae bacterium]
MPPFTFTWQPTFAAHRKTRGRRLTGEFAAEFPPASPRRYIGGRAPRRNAPKQARPNRTGGGSARLPVSARLAEGTMSGKKPDDA